MDIHDVTESEDVVVITAFCDIPLFVGGGDVLKHLARVTDRAKGIQLAMAMGLVIAVALVGAAVMIEWVLPANSLCHAHRGPPLEIGTVAQARVTDVALRDRFSVLPKREQNPSEHRNRATPDPKSAPLEGRVQLGREVF